MENGWREKRGIKIGVRSGKIGMLYVVEIEMVFFGGVDLEKRRSYRLKRGPRGTDPEVVEVMRLAGFG